MKEYRVLVTGGAGFIGSHLVDSLMKKGWETIVLDNLSSGNTRNIAQWLENRNLRLIRGDMKNATAVRKAVEDVELVFHFAANPEVRIGETDPDTHFQENLVATFNLLEAMKESNKAKTLIFASTSTVYGEASIIPTPEDYGPLIPISTYGASKLGCEALACSYAHTFSIHSLVLRFANVAGSRTTHGVVVDFIRKLRVNPNALEILGDGTQKKSYLYIEDCIDSVLKTTHDFLESKQIVEICNIGASDQLSVKRIAEIVVREMGLRNVRFTYTGGVDGGRGWFGDVKNMNLSVEKLLRRGWTPKYNSEQAIRLSTRALLRGL